MQAGSYPRHAAWTHGDERRIYLTLGISILLHAVLLLAWKLAPQVWKTADHAVLTVALHAEAPRQPRSPAPARQQREAGVLVQSQPAPAVLPMPATPAALGSVTPPAAASAPSLPESQAGVTNHPIPGRLSNPAAAAVGVTVTLVIGLDGRVQQIYWDKLPALTDEQLRRVETAIRDKAYASGQVINEIFDVRAFLKLPPARVEQAPAPVLADG